MARIRKPIPDSEPNKAFLEAYIERKDEHEEVLVWKENNCVNVEHPGSVAYAAWGDSIETVIQKDKETWGFTQYKILDKAPWWAITWS